MNREKAYIKEELDIIVKYMDYDTKTIVSKLEEAGFHRSTYSVNYKIRLLGTFHLSRKEVKILCTAGASIVLMSKLERHNQVCDICHRRIDPVRMRRKISIVH